MLHGLRLRERMSDEIAHYTLSEQGGTLLITLPRGANWAELILRTAAAALFTRILFPAAIVSFHRHPWHFYDHMLMYGGFGFALALASSLFRWGWTLLGKQVVTLDGISLVHRREILGIGFSREYDWRAVQDFRVRVQTAAQNLPGAPAAARLFFIGGAVMAFDYGARTYELGRGLDQSSAAELVARITQRFPSIAESPVTV